MDLESVSELPKTFPKVVKLARTVDATGIHAAGDLPTPPELRERSTFPIKKLDVGSRCEIKKLDI